MRRGSPDLRNFYPHPPRGGRRWPRPGPFTARPFLSTPSARRATSVQINMDYNHIISIHALREEGDTVRPSRLPNVAISIHALREEGDPKPCATPAPTNDFYPRPPRGGRLMCAVLSPSTSNFYPRPPRGGRPNASIIAFSPSYFYPRPPRGGRLQQLVADLEAIEFLSTPSARRATCVPW